MNRNVLKIFDLRSYAWSAPFYGICRGVSLEVITENISPVSPYKFPDFP
ncbi:MAG: hypothetical protein HZB98_07370 [Bacteroidia bacterium]|nr:hypothetical protein [Bacteroidia bacterium]